jgi:hypothetical protein
MRLVTLGGVQCLRNMGQHIWVVLSRPRNFELSWEMPRLLKACLTGGSMGLKVFEVVESVLEGCFKVITLYLKVKDVDRACKRVCMVLRARVMRDC